MVRRQDVLTRSDAGPMLGSLAALGLTMAFVALRRSKARARARGRRQADRPWRPTCAITWLAQIRPSRWSRVSAIPTGEARRAPSSRPCTNSFARTEASSRGSWPNSETPRGQSNDWPVGRPASALRVVAGGAPGDLSLFRTLEALAIGVQGKRCLWRAAQALVALPHPPGRRSFVELEADAVRQWETIERHRRSLVPRTFGV